MRYRDSIRSFMDGASGQNGGGSGSGLSAACPGGDPDDLSPSGGGAVFGGAASDCGISDDVMFGRAAPAP